MSSRILLLGFLPFFLASCAHPLETIAEQRHQDRIDASNANQPLTHGAGDGLGKSFAQSQLNMSLRTALQDP